MNQIEVTGMILVAGPIGEHDRRVEILTKERGRISAFAKGARRQNSPLLSVANPFVFGTFTLYAGKNSYTLVSAKVENYFGDLRTDIENAYYAMYFLELSTYFTREGNDETLMLKLLYQSMRALMKKSIDRDLIKVIFEMKTMVIQGEGLEVFQCISCGRNEFDSIAKEAALVLNKGGILCSKCCSNQQDIMPIKSQQSTYYAMQFINHSSVEKLYTFVVSVEVLMELQRISEEYLKLHVDKKFKTLDFLELIK